MDLEACGLTCSYGVGEGSLWALGVAASGGDCKGGSGGSGVLSVREPSKGCAGAVWVSSCSGGFGSVILAGSSGGKAKISSIATGSVTAGYAGGALSPTICSVA